MLKLYNITLMYTNSNFILDNVSIALASPGRFALMGASGSGKTTFLKAIAGLVMPSSGTFSGLAGKRIALMFQEDRLLPWCTVLKNVMLAMSVPSESEAKRILSKLEIDDHFAYPLTFSGGMKRRVALARAIAYKPDVLLLDEPFKGIDVGMKIRLAEYVKNSAPFIIFSTHDEDEAAIMEVSQTLHIVNKSIII